MLVGRKKCSRTQIDLASYEKHLQTVVTFLKMDMFPKEVIEMLPAFCRDSQLLSKWRFVIIIRNYDQLDSFASTVGSNSDSYIVLLGLVNIEFVKQPLCKQPWEGMSFEPLPTLILRAQHLSHTMFSGPCNVAVTIIPLHTDFILWVCDQSAKQ